MSFFDSFSRKESEKRDAKTIRFMSSKDIIYELTSNVQEDKKQYPEDENAIIEFFGILESDCRDRYSRRERDKSVDASVRCYLSSDRMRAYACMLPPINHGADLDLEKFIKDLGYDGVTYGVARGVIARYVFSKKYLHIFPAAQGKLPIDSVDCKVTELFPHRDAISLEISEGSEGSEGIKIDFEDRDFVQSVEKDEILCRIQPAVPGKNGRDVTGAELPCKEANKVQIPMGIHTHLNENGTALLAGKNGILYSEGGKYCVQPHKIITGDLVSFEGKLRVFDNLLITGNIDGGVEIEATGDIIVGGEVRDARMVSTSGGIRVQRGIHGVEGKTSLKAAKQLQSASIVSAQVETGGDVITEVAVDSSISTGGSLVATGGHGLILGCRIQAAHHVSCQRLGNLSGKRSQISVGCSPGLIGTLENLKNNLAEVSHTKERLWESIVGLRKTGLKLSENQKTLMSRLVEQRNLYEEKEVELKEQLRTLRPALRATENTGWIRCKEMFPVAEIQIGELKIEFNNLENNCNIHVRSREIVIR